MSPMKKPPDNEDDKEVDQGVVKNKRKLSQKTLAARARSGTIMGERYKLLQATCRDLPRTGRVARTKIIQAGYLKIQALEAKVWYLHGQLVSRGTPAPAPTLPGLDRTVSPPPGGIPGVCGYHQEQGDALLVAEDRGGGQPPQQDSSQRAEVRGGMRSDVQHQEVPHSAYTWGGRRQAEQEVGQHRAEATGEASQPEVLVIWQGAPAITSAPRPPTQPACTSTRPFLAGSPPLEERSWVPTSTEISWNPRQERFNLFSSTLERIISPLAKMTMVSPTSLRIPALESRFPGTRWAPSTSYDTTMEGVTTNPMDLTCPRKPLESILHNSLLRNGLLTSARATSTWSTPSSPGHSFLHSPASEIANMLRTPDRTTATDAD